MTGPVLRYDGPAMGSGCSIRPCRAGDRDALYQICIAVGDAGQDARSLYRDPELLGHIYAGPYLALEPDLAALLEDESGPCGYVLGARDTVSFERRRVDEWLPPLRRRYPAPTGDPLGWGPDEREQHLLHVPDVAPPGVVDAFPAHLHINLLPRAQGQGQGRRMIEWLFAELRARDAPGVHLAVSARNQRAIGFYVRTGFTELVRTGLGQTVYMGRALSDASKGA